MTEVVTLPDAGQTETNTGQETETTASESKPMQALRGRYKESGHCGDELATVLAGLSVDGVIRVAAQFVADFEEKEVKYAKLNPGQKRMNFSNLLRGLLNKKVVTIGDIDVFVKSIASNFQKEAKRAKLASPVTTVEDETEAIKRERSRKGGKK